MNTNLLEEDLPRISTLAQTFGLTLRKLNPRQFLMQGEGYVIELSLDFDGLSITYLDLRNSNRPQEYSLAHYIGLKRAHRTNTTQKDVPKDIDERLRMQISCGLKMLEEFAPDILTGSLEWIKDYPWEPHQVSLTRTEEILYAIKADHS